MVAREDIGSWLGGGRPGDRSGPGGAGLGLPATGPGALAPLGRRLAALAVDWALCLAISTAFLEGAPMATLLVFAAENVVLVGTAGYTVGHRLLGLGVRTHVPPAAVVPARGGSGSTPTVPATPTPPDAALLPGPLRALVRTALLCLVIPAVVRDDQGRSLHDRAAGTVIVRR